MRRGDSRTIAFVVRNDDQCVLTQSVGKQCQHIHLAHVAVFAEVGGTLFVAGNGAVTTDDEILGASVTKQVWPYHQFGKILLGAVGSVAFIAQRYPSVHIGFAIAALAVLVRIKG